MRGPPARSLLRSGSPTVSSPDDPQAAAAAQPPSTGPDPVAYVRPTIRALDGYTPGEQQPGFTKLNTNESAIGPSPKVLGVLAAIADESLRLYPDPVSRRLRETAAARFGVTPAEVLAGNGS